MQHQHFYIESLHLSDSSLLRNTESEANSMLLIRAHLHLNNSEQINHHIPQLVHSHGDTHTHTRLLTDTVPLKQEVWLVSLDSTPFLDFVESHSWPGRPQGYISQTYTQQF